MEWVPETYLERIVITPEYDTASVKVRVFLNGPDAGLTKKITVRESEAPDAKVICVRETRENEAELILGNFAGWSPEHPHLYGVSIEAGEDRIESYFGMRKFGIGKDEKGITRLSRTVSSTRVIGRKASTRRRPMRRWFMTLRRPNASVSI